jgi:DNA-binding MurR/RpiR family transcriptional regulator
MRETKSSVPSRGEAPTTFEDLKELVLSRHDGMSRQLKRIARYSIDNPDAVALNSVTALAQKAEVQPSAIVRFAKALGYDGFSGLQPVFRDYLVTRSDSYQERIRSLSSGSPEAPARLLADFVHSAVGSLENLQESTTEEQMDAAIALLKDSRDIHLLGQRRSFAVVQYLHYALSRLGCRCLLADGAGGMLDHQMARCGVKDAVIAVSFSPYTQQVLDLASKLSEAGVSIIAITDSPLSPLARVSKVSFMISEGDTAFRSLVAPMCLAQTLVVGLGQAIAGGEHIA